MLPTLKMLEDHTAFVSFVRPFVRESFRPVILVSKIIDNWVRALKLGVLIEE